MTGMKVYRKITAVLLLLVLLLTNVVQLSHTHKAAVSFTQKAAGNTKKHGYAAANADAKCFICDYQLTKDADFSHYNFRSGFIAAVSPHKIISSFFAPADFIAFYENRGPPRFESVARVI